MQVTLIDVGTGNIFSVYNTLARLGAEIHLAHRPEDIFPGRRIVLPGVGAFGEFMFGLRTRGLEEPILNAASRGDPLLGICVGMQALFTLGLEMGEHAGLGLLPGQVERFAPQPGLKIPHTGWNQLWFEGNPSLLRGLSPGCYVYFNHSFYARSADPADVLAHTDYGPGFTSLVQRNNLYGTQFHPEKSQRVGQILLENFLTL
jgi:imidazole glycerol-phosphate synthase subunit HisH